MARKKWEKEEEEIEKDIQSVEVKQESEEKQPYTLPPVQKIG